MNDHDENRKRAYDRWIIFPASSAAVASVIIGGDAAISSWLKRLPPHGGQSVTQVGYHPHELVWVMPVAAAIVGAGLAIVATWLASRRAGDNR